MQIANNSVVAIAYTLTDDEGQIIDQSEPGQPLYYLHGFQNIIPGLENALLGKQLGDKLKVAVEPGEGYGEYNPGLVQTVPKHLFGGVDEVEVGMQFRAETDEGVRLITVAAVEGNEVTVDGNHPLAGVPLNFDVEIVEVRAASAEELQHGHVHGPGGHHH